MSTEVKFSDYFKTGFQSLNLEEALRESPRILIGVSNEIVEALKIISIHTMFDLATSKIFNDAVKITEAGQNPQAPFSRHGRINLDMVEYADSLDIPIEDLLNEGIGILKGIGGTEEASIRKALNIFTVRELSLYPPFRIAHAIFQKAFFPENEYDFDPEMPTDLLPKTGEYPAEKAFFEHLMLDKIEGNNNIKDIQSPDFGSIDLVADKGQSEGFNKIGFGKFITVQQSWFVQGVTLGQLLHSTALAPGESTRIAVIDWSRNTSGSQQEGVSEEDRLSNTLQHNRAINEVTTAVATEIQEGRSTVDSESRSRNAGIGIGAVIPILPVVFGIGGAASGGKGSSHVETFSTSMGRRDMAASLTQNINDRTHQKAHSVRSRRASVIREVSQSEHEQISTRAITNYNHMHSLTMQYYEVIQVYRVETKLKKVEKCVFVPFSLLDFNNDAVIEKYRLILAAAALGESFRDLLLNANSIEVDIDITTIYDPRNGGAPGVVETTPSVQQRGVSASAAQQNIPKNFHSQVWNFAQLTSIATLLGRNIVKTDSPSVFLPDDALLTEARLSTGSNKITLNIKRKDGVIVNPSTTNIPIAELSEIFLKGSEPTKDETVSVTLIFNRSGTRFPLDLPNMVVKKGDPETKIIVFKGNGFAGLLKEHLNLNRLHYSQAIFRSLDAAAIAGFLSSLGYNFNGNLIPLLQLVEPTSIGIIGNYMVFKMGTPEETWSDELRDQGLDFNHIDQEIIPLSTGGVFCEAVLGRYNCAEKLDITRFWNWQDSPIPITAPDINSIQALSRRETESFQAGQLSSPIINIQQPNSLPDPTGLNAIIGAIQRGDMFRDMSGLSDAIKLAQEALKITTEAATAAGSQAGANLSSTMSQYKGILEVVAKLEKENKPQNISEKGAKSNQEEKAKKNKDGKEISLSSSTSIWSNILSFFSKLKELDLTGCEKDNPDPS